MREKASSYSQIRVRAGLDEASLFQQKALKILSNDIDIATLRWHRCGGENVGLTQVPEQKSHRCPISGTIRNMLPSCIEKSGDPRFV